MKLADFPELAASSEAVKLDMIDQLLKSAGYRCFRDLIVFQVDPEWLEIPDGIKAELERRWDDHQKGVTKGLTWEEFEEKLDAIRARFKLPEYNI
jgi:putative addiction module component (TIGR02574 family)